jgi:kynurenine formamidase
MISGTNMSTDQQADVTGLGQLRLIDLSVSLEQDAAGEMMKPQIEYVTHAEAGLQSTMAVFRAKPEDFIYSNGQGWAEENLSVNGHAGTHVDAPYHYGAISEGRPVDGSRNGKSACSSRACSCPEYCE